MKLWKIIPTLAACAFLAGVAGCGGGTETDTTTTGEGNNYGDKESLPPPTGTSEGMPIGGDDEGGG